MGPPGCSNIKAAGPLAPEADVYRPMVGGSRSSAYAVSDAVQPWASSQTACQRNQRGQVLQRRPRPAKLRHRLGTLDAYIKGDRLWLCFGKKRV